VLRVELLQLAHRSEAHAPETVEGDGSFVDTLISLLCGIVCNNEQYNKSVGKTYNISYQDCFTSLRYVVTISTRYYLSLIVNTQNALSSTFMWWTDSVNVNTSSLTLLCPHKVEFSDEKHLPHASPINREWNINESLKSVGTYLWCIIIVGFVISVSIIYLTNCKILTFLSEFLYEFSVFEF